MAKFCGTLFTMVLLLMVAARKNNNKSRTRTFCSDYRLREYRTFYPLRQCQRSNSPRISATNTDSFEKCSEFAKGVKALALNYGRFNISSGKYPRNLFEVEREKKLRKGQYCRTRKGMRYNWNKICLLSRKQLHNLYNRPNRWSSYWTIQLWSVGLPRVCQFFHNC